MPMADSCVRAPEPLQRLRADRQLRYAPSSIRPVDLGRASNRSSKTWNTVTHVPRHFCHLSPRPLSGPLVPQDNMRGLLRRCKFNAFVSQSPQVNAFEQSLSTTEQDRRDSNVQLINKALTKILLDRVGPTTNSHVSSGGRPSCPVKRLANAARDELKRRVAFHLNGWTRMMSQDEDWNVIRRIVSPPAFPVHIRPGTENRSEHVPSENPCPNILRAARRFMARPLSNALLGVNLHGIFKVGIRPGGRSFCGRDSSAPGATSDRSIPAQRAAGRDPKRSSYRDRTSTCAVSRSRDDGFRPSRASRFH